MKKIINMTDVAGVLMKCPIFHGLSGEAIDNELEQISYKVKIFNPKETIAFSDEECRFLYVVIKGKVKGEMTDFSGKVIRIEELDQGKPLAPSFIFGKNNRFPVDVVALQKSEILVIPKDSLLQLFQQNQTILNNYLGLVSNRAQFLTSRIRFLSFQTIKGKIAHYLIQQSKKAGNKTFELKASHNELSEVFGVARPSLTRAMRELDKDKLIVADGKKITIVNETGLMELIQ
ncbi:Crp/Fnr family transcriptional regulator [Saccharicrinis sp. FJH54]|uniref:Crp/Fnr family transcriptional regulator n=1 Tax=Saccharicrinis sp. FJH54 TaxID=3344665 RepID=UPI0035D51015